MSGELKVSIIIPVYNVEQYLDQCIESVAQQTYRNLEIILVDDGSADRSGDICDRWGKQDSRIIVIHQENRGVSAAREAGIHHVSGQYTMFVDSDDWIEPDTVMTCLQQAEEQQFPECIIFSYYKEFPEKQTEMHVMSETQFMDEAAFKNKVHRRLFGLSDTELSHPERMENISTCWGKMYKSDLIREGRFYDLEEIGSFEDGLFNIFALRNCRSGSYIDRPLYHYRKTEGSLIGSYRDRLVTQWNHLFSILQGLIGSMQLDKEYNIALNNRIALSITGIGLNELANGQNGMSGHIRVIRDYLKGKQYQAACRSMNTARLPLPWKVLMFCARYRLAFGVYTILTVIDHIRKA